MDTPFDPLIEVMRDPALCQQLTIVPRVDLPVGLPPDLAQQAYQQILAQISVAQQPAIDYDLFMATVESPRWRSEFRQTGKLNAVRLPDMNVQVTAIRTGVGWASKDVDDETREDAPPGGTP